MLKIMGRLERKEAFDAIVRRIREDYPRRRSLLELMDKAELF